jgi:hypothetical protein
LAELPVDDAIHDEVLRRVIVFGGSGCSRTLDQLGYRHLERSRDAHDSRDLRIGQPVLQAADLAGVQPRRLAELAGRLALKPALRAHVLAKHDRR